MALMAKYVRPQAGYVEPNKQLTVNEVYAVTNVEMHHYHTNINLEGFGTENFNSVNFDFQDEKGNEVNIFTDPKYNPYLR